MRRPPAASTFSYSFGPGPVTPAIKVLIAANVAAFLAGLVVPGLTLVLGLRPADVIEHSYVWQPVTYMFLHGGIFHILFNMLALWMFGTELERLWGTRYFLKFYFVCGIGAGVLTVLFSLMPFGFAQQVYYSVVIGASGAIYGLLLAYALTYPERWPSPVPPMDFSIASCLTFEPLDETRYPCFSLAREAGRAGGTLPAVLNAADEVAVASFLAGRISFLDLYPIVADTLEHHQPIYRPCLEDLLEADRWARDYLTAKLRN